MAAPEPSRARHWARRVLGRDWYPEPQPLWVQQRIIGDPAMYTLVASAGRMLAGFASIKRTTASATGASSIAECGPHAGMADVAARMTAALGATGFMSFDFMIERASGNAFLLECNPRPNHVSHLGGQLGVDLCAALHQDLCAVAGGASRNVVPTGPRLSRTIALYPQEWLRAPDSDALHHGYHDVPWDDPDLVVRLAMDVITETAKSMPAREAGNPFNFPIFAKRSL